MKKRTKLKDRQLPIYSKGEEIFNMVSHIVGGGFSIIALISCLVVSIIHNNGYAIVSSLIYGFSQILLYTTSAVYHGLSPKKNNGKESSSSNRPLCNIYNDSRLLYTICFSNI